MIAQKLLHVASKRYCLPFTLVVALICTAQEKTATLTGTVVDAEGAHIVSATVQIEAQSGSTKTVQVDQEGMFNVRDLTPGTYQLQVSAPGFMRQRIRNIRIGPGEQRKIAVTLRVEPIPECHAPICL